MNNEITNYIIPPWDSRYGKLGHLWKRYNWDNLVNYNGFNSVFYFIPPELVLIDQDFSRGYRIRKSESNFVNEWTNWFSTKCIRFRLADNCHLTLQDYFDLCILHINRKLDRPRCDYCHSQLKFSNRIYYGYNQTYPWNTRHHCFCSKSCSASYQSENPDEFDGGIEHQLTFINARYDSYNKVYTDYRSYITRGSSNDICYLYIAISNDLYKFGITVDPVHRVNMFSINLSNLHILVKSTRLEVANIEAILKLDNNGEEYFKFDKLHNFILKLKSILRSRPVLSPFK